jgi:hypothetical protein
MRESTSPWRVRMSVPVTETATIAPVTPAVPAEPKTQDKPLDGPKVETFDAEYVGKLRNEAAKYRTEAKANAEAAAKLAAIEEANKTESQKLADRLAAAEAKVIEAERKTFAATKGVPASLIQGKTEAEWEASAAEALAWRGEVSPKLPAAPPAAGTQGNVGKPIGSGSEAEQLTQGIDAATKAGRHAEAISLKRQLSALNNKTT